MVCGKANILTPSFAGTPMKGWAKGQCVLRALRARHYDLLTADDHGNGHSPTISLTQDPKDGPTGFVASFIRVVRYLSDRVHPWFRRQHGSAARREP